jgi:hypothetical protein
MDMTAPNHVASQGPHTLSSAITMVLHVRTAEAKTVAPPFMTTSTTPEAHLARLAKVVAKAKRVVVVCGESHLVSPLPTLISFPPRRRHIRTSRNTRLQVLRGLVSNTEEGEP